MKKLFARWRSLPYGLLIVLFFTGASALLAVIIAWDVLVPPRATPRQLSSPPAAAIAVEGIDRSSFFGAHLFIRAADGLIYTTDRFTRQEEAVVWQVGEAGPAPYPDSPCQNNVEEQIEEAAGSLIECRAMRTIGEWCPGTIISVAVTADGDVWELVQEDFCFYWLEVACIMLVPVGFAIGVLIAMFAAVTSAIVRRRTKGPLLPET